MNTEQRGGMTLNKDFRSKTGNGSVNGEGRAIATPTGELHPQRPSLPPSLPLHLSLFIYFCLARPLCLSLCNVCRTSSKCPLCPRFSERVSRCRDSRRVHRPRSSLQQELRVASIRSCVAPLGGNSQDYDCHQN